MIQVFIQQNKVAGVEPSNVLQALEIVIDRTKFCGKILLTYEHGQLQHVQPTQNFTVDELVDYLSK